MNSEVRHHLSEDLLTAYAAGALPEAFALVVATHLSMCDECRATAESLDGIGGTLIEGLDGAAMDAGALEAVLGRLDDAPATPIRVERGVLPAPVRAYIGGDLDAVKWKSVGMGVKQAVLKTSDSASARLLYIPAGAAMPEHSHRGMELTLVLQGAFEDDSDRFGPAMSRSPTTRAITRLSRTWARIASAWPRPRASCGSNRGSRGWRSPSSASETDGAPGGRIGPAASAVVTRSSGRRRR